MDAFDQAVGQGGGPGDGGVDHDHGQLVASVSGDQVVDAGGTADHARRLLDHLVAVLVAHRVVDRLEAVDVDQQH